MERRDDEPQLAEGLNLRILPFPVRAELRGLSASQAETVGGHLLMAGQLLEEDPELAYRHADAAKRRAARLPVAREALAETAYAAGHFEVALNEMRALRRMTGTEEYLAAMADCERALGRPQNALKLAKEGSGLSLDPHQRVELTMVEAGARDDLGQDAEAKRLLKRAIEDLGPQAGKESLARLQFAFGDLLTKHDDRDGVDWVMRAITLDPTLDPAGDGSDDYEVDLDVVDEQALAELESAEAAAREAAEREAAENEAAESEADHANDVDESQQGSADESVEEGDPVFSEQGADEDAQQAEAEPDSVTAEPASDGAVLLEEPTSLAEDPAREEHPAQEEKKEEAVEAVEFGESAQDEQP